MFFDYNYKDFCNLKYETNPRYHGGELNQSIIFLQKIAPKTNPNPQLNQLIIKVNNVIINALLELFEQIGRSLLINLFTIGLKANTCPKRSINIICTANANPLESQRPSYQ